MATIAAGNERKESDPRPGGVTGEARFPLMIWIHLYTSAAVCRPVRHGWGQGPRLSAMTELELVQLARSGDHEAFARLVDPLSVRLCLLIRRLGNGVLGPDQDAEDLLQVVLARAWNLLPSFEQRGVGSFHGWLVSLARGALSDRRKYLDAKGRGTVRHLESSAGQATAAPAHLTTSISRAVSRREQAARAAAALAALPGQYREVVEPHLLEARSLRDIAAGLGITANAAWERLHRGLDVLRSQLT